MKVIIDSKRWAFAYLRSGEIFNPNILFGPIVLSTSLASKMASRAERVSRRVAADEEDDDDLTKVEFETSEGVEVIPTFDGIGLREDLLRGIYAYG